MGIFCKGGGGVNHLAKKIFQVAQIFTKQLGFYTSCSDISQKLPQKFSKVPQKLAAPEVASGQQQTNWEGCVHASPTTVPSPFLPQ